MATLQILLDRRNRWQQVMNMKVFRGVKDIFRNNLPQEAGKAFFAVTLPKSPFVIALLKVHVTMVTTTKTTKTTMTTTNNEGVVAKFQKQQNGNKCVMLN